MGVVLPTQGVLSPLCYALELVRFRNSVEKESVSFVAELPWAVRLLALRADPVPSAKSFPKIIKSYFWE